jgi:acetyltransferase-like isoleucine patch superfamily enzyme
MARDNNKISRFKKGRDYVQNDKSIIVENINSRITKQDTTEIEPFSVWHLLNSEIVIGKNTHLGPFQQINLENAQLKIGDNVRIGAYTTIWAKGNQDKKVLVTIGDNERIDEYCHLHCFSDLDIGKDGHLFSGVYIGPFEQPFSIGERVTFAQKAVAAGRGSLKIDKYSMIGSLTVIITESHNYKRLKELVREQGFNNRGVVIGSDVWIGASVAILDGSIINDKTVIGAGSLVKGETMKGGVYYGIPIRKSTSLSRR